MTVPWLTTVTFLMSTAAIAKHHIKLKYIHHGLFPSCLQIFYYIYIYMCVFFVVIQNCCKAADAFQNKHLIFVLMCPNLITEFGSSAECGWQNDGFGLFMVRTIYASLLCKSSFIVRLLYSALLLLYLRICRKTPQNFFLSLFVWVFFGGGLGLCFCGFVWFLFVWLGFFVVMDSIDFYKLLPVISG